jgi:hypothetical protein
MPCWVRVSSERLVGRDDGLNAGLALDHARDLILAAVAMAARRELPAAS